MITRSDFKNFDPVLDFEYVLIFLTLSVSLTKFLFHQMSLQIKELFKQELIQIDKNTPSTIINMDRLKTLNLY